MKISVIIPTYNEGENLVKCLESLSRQKGEDFEVIVVDDGSTDGSISKIKDRISNLRLKSLKILKQSHKGAGAARNLGAKLAQGEILVFVDADMTFDDEFLEKLIAPIEKGITKGTFSKEEIVSNWENVWARCWNINEGWEPKRRHPKNYPNHQPVFRAILKSEFDRVGGFTPGGYNDDWSLSEKLGYEAIAAPGAIFYHKNPADLKEVFNHAKWVGKRKYKLGAFGYLVAVVRVSLPFSIIIGLYKSLVSCLLSFFVFKIVYDFGVVIGIIDYLISGKAAK